MNPVKQSPKQPVEDYTIVKNDLGEEIFLFDPYNPLNVEITEQDVIVIFRKYGLSNVNPINMKLYRRAFIHDSYTRVSNSENELRKIVIAEKPANCIELSTKSNQRLEFLGDGVLECIVKWYLYQRFPKEDEGFMTEKKIALVKNEAIGKIAMEMGLHKWILLSKSMESKETRTNLKKLGCLFEAFLGALFLDFNKMPIQDNGGYYQNVFLSGPGFHFAQIFVESVFDQHVNWMELIRNDDNYKNILQVIIQKEFKVTPHYMEIDAHHPDRGYHMGVYLCIGQHIHHLRHSQSIPVSNFSNFQDIHQSIADNGGKIFIFMGEGTHKIKKKAEQVAGELSIKQLKLLCE